MKARIGSIEVEGTPEEILALMQSLPGGAMGSAATSAAVALGGREYVSEEVAFKALKRRPLSREQATLLSLLNKNYPAWTTALDLQKATKYKGSQLAGLLGAFGKRVGATEGYKAGTWFFDQEWNYEKDCNHYRLPEGVRRAVERVGL